jgi:hypothetical protein
MTPEERAEEARADGGKWTYYGVVAAIREAEACALESAAEHLERRRPAGLLGAGMDLAASELRRLAAETRRGGSNGS